MTNAKRWQGLRALIADAVEQGSSAIERVHLETARRPFTIVEQIPGIAEPARGIHEIHDAVVSTVYSTIRSVNRLASTTLEAAIDALDDAPDPDEADDEP